MINDCHKFLENRHHSVIIIKIILQGRGGIVPMRGRRLSITDIDTNEQLETTVTEITFADD